MSRQAVVDRFYATIMTTYTLPANMVDQWLVMATDDYIHFVDTDLEYSASINDPDYNDGTFNRDLLPGERQVLSLTMELYYTRRYQDGANQVISTDTKMSRNSGLDGRRRAYISKVDELETKIQTLYQQLVTFFANQKAGI